MAADIVGLGSAARVLSIVLVVFSSTLMASPRHQDWAAADRALRRLSPSTFSALPAAIRDDLMKRGCAVPQLYTAKAPSNVIRGHFFGHTSDDWAVLCSRQRVSAVLVYRQGQPNPAAEFGRADDVGYLQTIDAAGTVGFSRAILTASPEQIRTYLDRLSKPLLTTIDHDGIELAFVGKASTVHYFSNGKWIEIPGAD